MIGSTFTKQLELTTTDLDQGIEYITFEGKSQQSLGTTKNKFTITIGEGNNQTYVQTKLHLPPSDKFDVLLGSTFLAPIGGITDPWSQEFHYRVNQDLGGHKMLGADAKDVPSKLVAMCTQARGWRNAGQDKMA